MNMRMSLRVCVIGALLALAACSSKTEDREQLAASAQPPRADLMKIPDELKNGPQLTVNQAILDFVNETLAFKKSDQGLVFRAKTDAPIWFAGWAYDETHKQTPDRVWIELTGKDSGLRFFFLANRFENAAVADSFKVPWARMLGYRTPAITDHNIPRGAYDVKIYQIYQGVAELTKFYAYPSITVIVE
jgi:hypothetical protein